MEKEDLKNKISEKYPAVAFDDSSEWLNAEADVASLHDMALFLRHDNELHFDYLFCLTCIDWKTHLTMVYHFTSTMYRHHLVVKCKIDRQNPAIDSLSDIWETANFHEREVYEMFGVHFNNHPDLRLLILPDGWEGKNPLRKDFEDPVNMIKL